MDYNGDNNMIQTSDASTLECLPVEVLHEIASHLSATDVGSLRLTSRTTQNALFRYFATEFFSPVRILMPRIGKPEKLQKLADISEHQDLSRMVHEVTFIPRDKIARDDVADEGDASRMRGRSVPSPSGSLDPWADLEARFGAGGHDRPLLAAALARLENLRSICFQDSAK
jgi:hypothetical protein